MSISRNDFLMKMSLKGRRFYFFQQQVVSSLGDHLISLYSRVKTSTLFDFF